jgi:hypothetical protein
MVKKLERVDGKVAEVDAVYDLVVDMNTVRQAREKTGREISEPGFWKDLPPSDLLILCWCSLHRFHPEVTLEEVGQMFTLEQMPDLWLLLVELFFPGAQARIEAAQKEAEQKEAQGKPSTGEAEPAVGTSTQIL